MKKFLTAVIGLLLILSVVSWLGITKTIFTGQAGKLLVAAEGVGIALMLVSGTFYGSQHFYIARVLIVVCFVGFFLKILHLTGADQVLMLAPPALLAIYLIHFFSKHPSVLLDYLKLTTLTIFIVYLSTSLLHLLAHDSIKLLAWSLHIVFWVTFVRFLREQPLQNKS
jgi:hypothetical protein